MVNKVLLVAVLLGCWSSQSEATGGDAASFQSTLDALLVNMTAEYSNVQSFLPFSCQSMGSIRICLTEGQARDISSLSRLGPVTSEVVDGVTYVSTSVGLKSLNIQLKGTVKVWIFWYHVTFHIGVRQNAVTFKYRLGGRDNCTATIDDVEVSQLGGFTTVIDGMGVWDGLVDKNIVNYLNSNEAYLKQQALDNVQEVVDQFFSVINICDSSYEIERQKIVQLMLKSRVGSNVNVALVH